MGRTGTRGWSKRSPKIENRERFGRKYSWGGGGHKEKIHSNTGSKGMGGKGI